MEDSLSLKDYIKSYIDFPKKGIFFRDILPILEEPKVFQNLIKNMSTKSFFKDCDCIIAIDARGFIFGTAIALSLQKPLLLARKPGKLPGELTEKSYNLEYGTNSLSIQKEALLKYNNFVIVDDLLATGGTVRCVQEILKELNKKVIGLSVVVELKELQGSKFFSFPVSSEISF